MSFLRQGEARTYYEGSSGSYVYPSSGSGIRFRDGTMDDEGFGELILRAASRTELSDDSFKELVEVVTECYQTKEESDFVQAMHE